jgi:starch-binding outer membrane protein, SusD/RagB family
MRRHNLNLRRTLALTTLLIAAAGCGLLDTEQPDIIDPGDLENEAGARAKRIGAISEFTFAKDGDGNAVADGQILTSGLMSDEFNLSTTPPTQQEIDQRAVNINNVSVTTTYFQMHRARTAAEDAAAALQQFLPFPDDEAAIPEMLSLSGFTYVYFAETFCSGVPFSKPVGDSLVLGPGITTTAMLDSAITRFDSALAHTGVAADVNVEYLARIGRARALLNQGLFAEAAAEAALVPTDFVYVTEHAQSPFILQNLIFTSSDGGLWSLADNEGGTGLPYRTADDPRVPFFDTGDVGLDGSTPQFNLLKYPDEGAPVPVADGIEARLIEAEAAYQAGAFGAMFTFLDDLRALVGLPNLVDPGTAAGREDILFSERGFWLMATGHRLGDMRRLIRQYGRTESTVFPIGPYLKGGSYGTDVNIPVPIEEQNNPNFTGCIDRNP